DSKLVGIKPIALKFDPSERIVEERASSGNGAGQRDGTNKARAEGPAGSGAWRPLRPGCSRIPLLARRACGTRRACVALRPLESLRSRRAHGPRFAFVSLRTRWPLETARP